MKKHLMGSAFAGLVLLAAPSFAQTPSAAITAAVADASRPDADKAIDPMRKPAETVAFAGVKPGDKVMELAPGGGYFTRILAKAVGANGKIYTVAGRPALPPNPPVAANVTPVAGTYLEVAVPEPVDVIWTSRNYHDFQNANADMGPINRKMLAALKSGGIYLVLDHAAAANAPEDVTRTLHRAKESTVRSQVEAAGFRFVASSNVLANAADDGTKPVREQDVAGKTNQFILKFQKP